MKAIVVFLLFISVGISAQNLVFTETLSNCSLPSNWSLQSQQGTYSFSVTKSSLMPQSDPSCTIVYQQTNKTDNSARRFSISTSTLNLFRYTAYRLSFGLRFVKGNPNSSLKLYQVVDGNKTLVQSYTNDVVQNGIVLVTQNIDLALGSSAQKLSLSFEYECAANDNNAIILIDNLSLNGPDNDDCSRAVDIRLDENCLSGNNVGALFTGPQLSCSGSYAQTLWYRLVSDYSGWIELKSSAGFNDAITIFTGSCTNLTESLCFNQDEFGFGGEKRFLQVETAKTYYIRIARQTNYYGRDDLSDLCISLTKKIPNQPPNDLCAAARTIAVNSSCLQEVNLQATFEQATPSLNIRSRADIWYQFTATSSKALEIFTKADFADVITLYKGDCNQLTEIQCEDLGIKTIFENPVSNTKYFIQVSGYFSTIEGHLCLEVKERSTQKPANEDCVSAQALTLGQNCTPISSLNASGSGIKASCQVYAAPDVWYSFVAPAEREVGLSIQAGFMYNYAIFQGPCNNLTEISCGLQPDPCKGIIPIKNLIAGQTYYLQITPVVHPLRFDESNVCVKVDGLSKFSVFEPLRLELTNNCLHGVLGQISYLATGGVGPFTYTGPSDKEWFLPGTKVDAYLEDANGCRDFASLTIECAAPLKCKSSDLDIALDIDCLKDSIGRQTGEVKMNIQGKGGTGVYYLYGTDNGSILQHGDVYQVILIDSDSCFVIEEGKIHCPPFNCSQSTMRIQSQYTCVDTLLKAVLTLNVTGNLGSYAISGNQSGELLEQGQKYSATVTDAAGCSATTQGEIICKFDSCAYARPTLSVQYDCLKDTAGNNLGKAILSIQSSSYAGGITIVGNKNGDTLQHNERYFVQIQDAFGCSLEEKGVIQCVPVNSNDQSFTEQIRAFPNPCKQELFLEWYSSKALNAKWTLFTSTGNPVSTGILKPSPGETTRLKLNLVQFSSGTYYIKLEGKEFVDLLRFVKI